MNEDLRKVAEKYFDDNLAKIASVGHGAASTSGPGLVGGGAVGGLRPAVKNEDLEPSRHRDQKTLTTINKLFQKEAPKDIAAIAVMHGNNILMGKRKDSGGYNCPGGHVEDGETYENAALRELKEETGIEGHKINYMGSFPVLSKNLLVHVYKCAVYEKVKTNSKADPDEEVEAWEWFDTTNGLPSKVMNSLHNKKDIVLKLLGLQADNLDKSTGGQAHGTDFIPNTGLKPGNEKPYADAFDKGEKKKKSKRLNIKELRELYIKLTRLRALLGE